jgi:hypothetical protein
VAFTLLEASDITFVLTDISGKIVFSKSVSAPSGKYKELLDISELVPSIYFLQIQSPQGQASYKLIKN